MLIIVVSIAAIVWGTYWHLMSKPVKKLSCIGRLRPIWMSTTHWITTHNGQTPPSLKALLGRHRIKPSTFICPASDSEPDDDEFVSDYDSIFDHVGHAISYKGIDDPSNTLMIWEREANHDDGEPYRYVIFASGTLRRVREKEFQAALKKLPKK